MSANLEEAIREWANVLPPGAIVRDAGTLKARGISGLRSEVISVPTVVFPASTKEVSDVLRIADRLKIRVYPVSCGRNWGYGASAPVVDGCVVIDLSRMNRIRTIHRDLAYVEIEPGVTQGQLYAALEGTGLIMDATGAGPYASVMGATLERGFGHTLLADRAHRFVASEIVLADGTVIEPGYLGAGAKPLGYLAQGGFGGGLHQLLLQSNYAVVTRMALWLIRRPEAILRCIFFFDSDEQLPEFIDAMRRLKQEGVFDGIPHAGNELRALSMISKFPFDHVDPKKGLSDGDLEEMRKEFGIHRWTLACGIYGTKGVARAKARRAKEVLGRIGKVRIVSPQMFDRVMKAADIVDMGLRFVVGDRLKALLTRLHGQWEVLSLLDGKPTELALEGSYWRHRRLAWHPNCDPILDGCGFRWLSPAVPLEGDEVLRMVKLAKENLRAGGFEFAATLAIVSPRVCHGIISIYFDRENDDEWQRAISVTETLKRIFDKQGWRSYRLPIDAMAEEAGSISPELRKLLHNIKQAFDPNQILSPGRYEAL